MGSCLTLGNELSKETHELTKQETLLERGSPGRKQEHKGTQEDCCATWLVFYGDGISFRVFSGPSL